MLRNINSIMSWRIPFNLLLKLARKSSHLNLQELLTSSLHISLLPTIYVLGCLLIYSLKSELCIQSRVSGGYCLWSLCTNWLERRLRFRKILTRKIELPRYSRGSVLSTKRVTIRSTRSFRSILIWSISRLEHQM